MSNLERLLWLSLAAAAIYGALVNLTHENGLRWVAALLVWFTVLAFSNAGVFGKRDGVKR